MTNFAKVKIAFVASFVLFQSVFSSVLQDDDISANIELKHEQREKRQTPDTKQEDRKKMAEERKKTFLERKAARERGEPDPVEIKEEANRKYNDAKRKNESETGVKQNGGGKMTSTTPITTTTTTTTTTTEDPNTKRGNADSRTDTALTIVKTTLLDDEPISTGKVETCSNCNLYGISSVERTGRATAIDIDDDLKRVKVYLGVRHLRAHCNCTYGLATGEAKASVQKLVIYLDVIVDFSKDDTEIKNVTIKYPGILDFSFQGTNFFGWILQLFSGMFKTKVIASMRKRIINEVPRIVHENKKELRHLGMI